MKAWLVTGISGTNWKELFCSIKEKMDVQEGASKLYVYDLGNYMEKEVKRLDLSISPADILNVDGNLLEAIRSLAFKRVMEELNKHIDDDNAICIIGTHAVFRWRNRLIPGVSYYDLGNPDLKLSGVINVVDNLSRVLQRNNDNPVRNNAGPLSEVETQEWMNEEELLSRAVADIKKCPFYVFAHDHNEDNLIDFFTSDKKRIYLSYPITAIRETNEEELEDFLNKTLPDLEKKFIVFNPLAVKDLGEVEVFRKSPDADDDNEFKKIKELLSTRTVQRDFRFIDQSNAVVVYYNTDKNSPGVFAEIYYAYRTGKPVFVYYPYKASPFLLDAVTEIKSDYEEFLSILDEYSKKKN